MYSSPDFWEIASLSTRGRFVMQVCAEYISFYIFLHNFIPFNQSCRLNSIEEASSNSQRGRVQGSRCAEAVFIFSCPPNSAVAILSPRLNMPWPRLQTFQADYKNRPERTPKLSELIMAVLQLLPEFVISNAFLWKMSVHKNYTHTNSRNSHPLPFESYIFCWMRGTQGEN